MLNFLRRSVSIGAAAILALAGRAGAQPCGVEMVTPPTRQAVNGLIYTLAAYDDGGGAGPQLYLGGNFTATDPSTTALPGGIARVVGGTLQSLPPGGPPNVRAMTVFDDGSGPSLWVAGGTILRRWDGAAWTAAPSLSSYAGQPNVIKAIDLGGGPSLYAGTGTGVFRLDGTTWTELNGHLTITGVITGLEGFDIDGDGPQPAQLYAAGTISVFGGSGAAVWNGSMWQAVPGAPSFGSTKSLLTYDDGFGTAVYWGSHPGNLPTRACASRFDGVAWVFPVTSTPTGPVVNPGYAFAGVDFGPEIGRRVVSASLAGFIVSSPTGPWTIIPGSGPSPTYETDYTGALAAYRMPGSGVPVVVGVTSRGRALQRLAGCPRCQGDRNLDGAADLADLFDFLDEYFTSTHRVQQLFDFLRAWFAGC